MSYECGKPIPLHRSCRPRWDCRVVVVRAVNSSGESKGRAIGRRSIPNRHRIAYDDIGTIVASIDRPSISRKPIHAFCGDRCRWIDCDCGTVSHIRCTQRPSSRFDGANHSERRELMQYLKAHWVHSNPDDPIWLYSELDADRWEMRKVEIFADGQIGFASASEQTAGTRLGDHPVPLLAELNATGDFEASVIDNTEFEQVWSTRMQPTIHSS